MLKKALLAGINDYRQAPLRGCVNDVTEMKNVLLDLYDFKADHIRFLKDKEVTRQALIDGLKWLAEGGAEPAVRVFHYAGHGHFVPDTSRDEPDGADEALVPHDCAKNGYLIDDDLKKLYDRFPKNSNLTIIMDCCHSGTNQRGEEDEREIVYRFMPLTFEERKAIAAAKRKFNEEQRAFIMQELQGVRSATRGPDPEFEARIATAMKKFEKQRFGDVSIRSGNVLLAACQSDQKAADAKFDRTFHGAFTHTLVRILRESEGRISYRELIEQTGEDLHTHAFTQIPQLECEGSKQNAEAFSLF